MAAFKAGAFTNIFSRISDSLKAKQQSSAAQSAAQPAAQPDQRTSPFTARPRGQAANILAGDTDRQMGRQKRLLGE
jgi:hypothetical protein